MVRLGRQMKKRKRTLRRLPVLQAQVQLAHSQGPILVWEGGDLVPEPQAQAFRSVWKPTSHGMHPNQHLIFVSFSLLF